MTRAQRPLLLLLSLALLAAVACSKATKPSPLAMGSSVATGTAGPLITPQQLAAQPAGLATVRTAYNLLLNQ
ncbi:MAG TPA: hypothetical protein VND24_07750, partial [Steroidobacteraceae bacterium]|nr:hypothetical protein [Steroidobacteraceae bacterium]